jgi:hypothetical protein
VIPTTVRDLLRPGDDTAGRPLSRFVRRVALGCSGGLIATLVMTAFRIPTSRSLPPTAYFWAKFFGGGSAEDHPLAGLVLHLVYGAGGGVAFAVLAPGREGSEATAEFVDAVLGTVYGVALSAFGIRVVLGRLLGMELPADERLVFHLSHVVYGLTLGTWLGSRLGE